jgi:hypothetical protein
VCDTGYPEFDALEGAEELSVGSFSIQAPWRMRKDSLAEYWNQRPFVGSTVDLHRAFSAVAKFVRRQLRPSDLTTAFERMPSGNLGLPRMSRMREYAQEYLLRAQTLDRQDYIGGVANIFPAVLFGRVQPKPKGELTIPRDIWGMDHLDTIVGKSIVDPLLKVLRQLPEFAAWVGLDEVDRRVTQLLDLGGTLYSIDFRHFDKSLNSTIIDLITALKKQWFVRNAHTRIEFLADVFKHVGIVTPDGIWSGRDAGVPSGTGSTNIDDCLANALASHYVAIRLGVSLADALYMGDDAVWAFRPNPSVDEVAGALSELGLELNTTKTLVSADQVHFLQRLYLRRYVIGGVNRGVRSVIRTINSMMSHEYMRRGWSRPMNTVRWCQQANGPEWHPNFVDFIHWYYLGDEYLRDGRTAEMALEEVGVGSAESLLNITSFPWNKRALSGFAAFASVKALHMFYEDV